MLEKLWVAALSSTRSHYQPYPRKYMSNKRSTLMQYIAELT